MKDRLVHTSDLSIIPLNETAIILDDKLIVMDSLEVPFTSQSAEALERDGRFPMKLPLNTIMVVVKGEVRFSVNFHNYVATADMCAFIAAGTIVEQLVVDDGTRLVMLSFSQQDFPQVANYQVAQVNHLYTQQVTRVALFPQHIDVMMETYRMLRTILTDSAFAPMKAAIATHCIHLMASIIENSASGQDELSAKSTRKDEIVTSFLKCVANNYRTHREISFYANQLGLSLKYMSHVVYEQTGRHPSQWIKDYVILDAKTMLRSGLFTVQQVADELHFPNQSFFGKYFKEAVGISPKKYSKL